MSNILAEICEYKKGIVSRNKEKISLSDIKNSATKITSKANFSRNIELKIANEQKAIIAEIKRKSPSKGIIAKDFDLEKIVKHYDEIGAAGISILTDEKYFSGSDQYLIQAKTITSTPILRKDFIIDEYQIYESKIIGADAILLILSALDPKQALEYEQIALDLGLDVLVETHDRQEIELANKFQTKLIGVNNRNLKDFTISLDNVINLKQYLDPNKILISESGINSEQDIKNLQQNGINAFLIGSYLMQQR
jgi:indole-3-glycerol phosphate synthase